MTGEMFAAFCVSWASITLLAYVMYRVELAGKRTDANLRELREALAAVSSGEKYVAAAYGVFVVVVLVWVAILAAKLSRLERETGELAQLARARAGGRPGRWLSCSSGPR